MFFPDSNGHKTQNMYMLEGHLSHAYLICGPVGSGKHVLAETIAAAMVCEGTGKKPCMLCRHCRKSERGIHPDIVTIDREVDRKEIYVDQIRNLKSDAVILPNEAEKKVYIIKNAGSMNLMAQNALLKLLEEPPPHVALILITENAGLLLETVRSRCVELNLIPQESGGTDEISEPVRFFFEVLCSGDQLRMLKFFFSLEKLSKSELAAFIQTSKETAFEKLRASLLGADSALSKELLIRLALLLDRMGEYMEFNVGTGHIAGLLCAELIDRK